jgi:uncharacterized protein (TIGR00369 family)
MKVDSDIKSDYYGIDVPFMEHIGLEAVSTELNTCVTRLPLTTENVNRRGVVHGGVLMSALDLTFSAAARSYAPLDFSAITIDLTTHFLNPARSELHIEGRCVPRGNSFTFCEDKVRDQQMTAGKACSDLSWTPVHLQLLFEIEHANSEIRYRVNT